MASAKYKELRNYYLFGLWDKEMLKKGVVKRWITAEEYKEITGIEYEK